MDYINVPEEITYDRLKRLYEADKESQKKTGQRIDYWDLLNIFGNKFWDFTDKIDDIENITYKEMRVIIGTYSTLDLRKNEEAIIKLALLKTKYVQKEAAKLLGISARVLNYKVKQYQITHKSWAKNK